MYYVIDMTRALHIAFVGWVALCLVGCDTPEESKPLWEQVKIGDIAPRHHTKRSMAQMLKTISFGVHIFEIPADKTDALDEVWYTLYKRRLRFNNYDSFRANSFSIGFGQVRMWNRIQNMLYAANGQKVATVSLLLSDGEDNDLVVTGLDSQRTVYYTAVNGSKEAATVGPGIIALRMKAEKIAGLTDVCTLIAYPVFSLPAASSIPELSVRAKRREFLFRSAAFGLKMGPGDFVVLGPEKYISDQTALGGLFFSKPEGSLFFSATERKPPELKPAVRIFLLLCTKINY
jgi:hypothetical protein